MTEKLEEFYDITDAEEYFEFFDIDFDKTLVNVKRFHMMKEYGQLIKTASENISDEEQLLNFYKFSLLRVYGDYKNGHAPSAAEVWNMFETGKLAGCGSCAPTPGNSCGC